MTNRRRFLAGVGAAGVASTTGCLGLLGGGGDDGGATGLSNLPNDGADEYISQVEQFESNGTDHVDGEVDYERTPPLSGSHWNDWVSAGFYEERQTAELLVHTLEHGGVVAYYDPTELTEGVRLDLRDRAQTYTETFAPFVAAPALRDSPPVPYTLTAWQNRLRLDSYDEDAVTAFVAEFIGRGPENPIR